MCTITALSAAVYELLDGMIMLDVYSSCCYVIHELLLLLHTKACDVKSYGLCVEMHVGPSIARKLYQLMDIINKYYEF